MFTCNLQKSRNTKADMYIFQPITVTYLFTQPTIRLLISSSSNPRIAFNSFQNDIIGATSLRFHSTYILESVDTEIYHSLSEITVLTAALKKKKKNQAKKVP